jgi:hypothetical protein
LIILSLRVVANRAQGIVTDLLGEIIVDFGAITSRFLAMVETAVNVEVRLTDKDGTNFFRGDLVFVGDL